MSKNSKRKARRARAGGGSQKTVQPGPVKSEKLTLWQERLALSDADWAGETGKMDEREAIYKGDRKLKPLVKGDRDMEEATHVRNIVFENIESMVSSVTPNPKVTAIHEEDEPLAEIIENMIRNLMDKLPSETNNDLAERTVPIQGGVLFHEEWDDRKRTHDAIGAFCDTVVHPKQLAPQPGVYTDIEDMNWLLGIEVIQYAHRRLFIYRRCWKHPDMKIPLMKTVISGWMKTDGLSERRMCKRKMAIFTKQF